MSEKKKMLEGHPYDAWDAELVNERMLAKAACHQFNLADPGDLKARMALLEELINFKGSAHIEPNFFCDYGYNITIGNNFYANHNLTIVDVCQVKIGENVLIGPGVMISTGAHPIDPVERLTTEYGVPVEIGDDVWIGGNVSILPGVKIGSGCVIGAGSVVTKDIPANKVAVGSPCRVIKSTC